MGQQQSSTAPSRYSEVHTPSLNPSLMKFAPIEHEGLLRLRTVPFKNSVQVSTSPCLFMEKADITLAGLLEDRYNTTKLFTEEDLTNLLESVLYTLAYLETKNVVYLDLSTSNIFYDPEEASFKLFPAQLIIESGYELAMHNHRQSLLSPEMIIALRCHEQAIDVDLYHKSNMFLLGMIMLECGSLRPAVYCYDAHNLDIIDKEIRERLSIIEEFYSDRLLKYIAMLLEYDFSERVFAKDLSLLFNRELTEDKVSRLKKVTGKEVSVSRRAMEESTDQSNKKWDKAAADLARSHIDSLAMLNSSTNIAQPPPQASYRNHINLGRTTKTVTSTQQVVQESFALQQPPNRKSVSPARIPGFKPHVLAHHSPVPPIKGIPGSIDSTRPFDPRNLGSKIGERPTSNYAEGTIHRESYVGQTLFRKPNQPTTNDFTAGLGARFAQLSQPSPAVPQRLTPVELAQRLAMKTSGINQPKTPNQLQTTTPPQLRSSSILKAAPQTSSFTQLPPVVHQPADTFSRMPVPPPLIQPPPQVSFNYLDVSQKYNPTNQNDTYQQQSHSTFNSDIKEIGAFRSPDSPPREVTPLHISPLQKQSVTSQQSLYPTQFHLLSSRGPPAPIVPALSVNSYHINSHEQSETQDYSIAKIKEEIQKSRRLIQQLQNESKPAGSLDRTPSPIK